MNTTTTNDTHHSSLSPPTWIAIALVVIGALNWGLVGLFSFNLVAAIFGEQSVISRIVYVVVAIAARARYVWELVRRRGSDGPTVPENA